MLTTYCIIIFVKTALSLRANKEHNYSPLQPDTPASCSEEKKQVKKFLIQHFKKVYLTLYNDKVISKNNKAEMGKFLSFCTLLEILQS